MYIEWKFEEEHAYVMRFWVDAEIRQWAEKYSVPIKTKSVKSTYRLILGSAEEYTFFTLTWNPLGHDWLNYSIKEPMNIDKNH